MSLRLTLAAIILMALPAHADPQAYESCKEQALQNLATRYERYFTTETQVAGAAAKAQTYMSDYSRAKQGCGSNYDCLDGAINSAATRFSAFFNTDLNLDNSSTAQSKFQAYQADYRVAEESCRNQNLQSSSTCIAQNQSVINNCVNASISASNTCNPSQNADLQRISQDAATLASSGSGPSTQQSCQKAADLSSRASTAVSAYSSGCSTAKATCSSTCEQAKQALHQCQQTSGDQNIPKTTQYQSVYSSSDSCATLSAKTAEAQQLMQSYTQTQSSSSACAAATGTTGTGTGTTNNDGTAATVTSLAQAAMALAGQTAAPTAVDPSLIPSTDPNSPYCQANPTLASCVANCSRTDLPNIASSQTCVCYRNPTDPSCGGALNSSSLSNGITGTGGGTSLASTTAQASDLDLPNAPFNGVDLQPNNGIAAEDIGGKQGNGAQIGDGSGLSPSSSGLRGSNAAFDDATPTFHSSGFSGGGGSSGAFASSSSGSSGGGGGFPSGNHDPANKNAIPDLRQFLPGGHQDPQRRIAGSSGPDGITGPESVNWMKISNRYRYLLPSLLP